MFKFINIGEERSGRPTDDLVVAESTAVNGEAEMRRPQYGRLGRRGANGATDAYRSQSTNARYEGPVSSVVGRSEDPHGLIWSPWPAGSEWRNRRLVLSHPAFNLFKEK